MKTYDNRKCSNEKFSIQHIFNNIQENDIFIDGCGTKHICTYVDIKNNFVIVKITKKDGTPHKGLKEVCFLKSEGWWECVYE